MMSSSEWVVSMHRGERDPAIVRQGPTIACNNYTAYDSIASGQHLQQTGQLTTHVVPVATRWRVLAPGSSPLQCTVS